MANSEAAISVSAVYPDPNALPNFPTDFPTLPVPVELLAPHAAVTRAPHTDVTSGAVTVTNGSVASTSFALNLGSITTEVTAFVMRNNTAQDLNVSINGTANVWSMPPGAVLAYATPVAAATPITSIAVVTTATQVGNQTVSFTAWGDPT